MQAPPFYCLPDFGSIGGDPVPGQERRGDPLGVGPPLFEVPQDPGIRS